MDLETIWYEYAPYLYIIAGIIAIEEVGSTLGICIGAALIAGAGAVLVPRWLHRLPGSRKDNINVEAE
jgi:hypothetical protein